MKKNLKNGGLKFSGGLKVISRGVQKLLTPNFLKLESLTLKKIISLALQNHHDEIKQSRRFPRHVCRQEIKKTRSHFLCRVQFNGKSIIPARKKNCAIETKLKKTIIKNYNLRIQKAS